jgi:inner membrane protein YhjD
MPWTTSRRVVAIRERSVVVDIAVETLDGWRRHISGRNASLLSFWAFLSIFPLLMVATTIVGFVLQNNQDLQDDIVNSVLADIPVLGAELAEDPTAVKGNAFVLLFGLVAALWSGTRAFVGVQSAFDDVWEVPVDDRSSMPVERLRALVGIVIIGTSHVISIGLSALIQTAGLPGIGRIILFIGSTLIHIVVIAAMYRYLTSADPTWRDVWPGAILAGVVYGVLQHYATALVGHITENASDTYGQFALVLGLVTWLGLLSITTIMCAELNAAIVRRPSTAPSTSPVGS